MLSKEKAARSIKRCKNPIENATDYIQYLGKKIRINELRKDYSNIDVDIAELGRVVRELKKDWESFKERNKLS